MDGGKKALVPKIIRAWNMSLDFPDDGLDHIPIYKQRRAWAFHKAESACRLGGGGAGDMIKLTYTYNAVFL